MGATPETRYGRREFLKRLGIGTAAVASIPLIEVLSSLKAEAESGEEIQDLTYAEFANLPRHPEDLINILKSPAKTLIITLNTDARLERLPTEPIVYLGDSKEALIKSMVMERVGRGSLVYIYTSADQKGDPVDLPKGKALEFERIPVSEETVFNFVRNSTLPFVFRGITGAPVQTPAPAPSPTPKPSPCPIFELPCYRPPVQYASHHR